MSLISFVLGKTAIAFIWGPLPDSTLIPSHPISSCVFFRTVLLQGPRCRFCPKNGRGRILNNDGHLQLGGIPFFLPSKSSRQRHDFAHSVSATHGPPAVFAAQHVNGRS